jgi:hypothetical protein
MTKEMWIDPPEGWRYGFPKRVPSGYLKNETLMRLWLQQEGYPESEIMFALRYSRYWSTEPETIAVDLSK